MPSRLGGSDNLLRATMGGGQPTTASDLPLLVGMACSGGGPALAAVFSNPLDVAKVRMMMQGEGAARGAGVTSYTGPIDCIAKTYRAEGVRGVQRGLSMCAQPTQPPAPPPSPPTCPPHPALSRAAELLAGV